MLPFQHMLKGLSYKRITFKKYTTGMGWCLPCMILWFTTSCVQSADPKHGQAPIDTRVLTATELAALDAQTSFQSDITLTSAEQEVQQKLDSLRTVFIRQNKQQGVDFYRRPFHDVKQIIDTSQIYKIIQTMPKGAILHTHSSGMTSAKWIIDEVRTYSNGYVFTAQNSPDFVYGELAIFTNDSIPEGFVRLSQKLKADPTFENELHGLLTLKGNTPLSEDVWVAFEKRFLRLRSLIGYRPFFSAYYKRGFLELLADHVTHVEIRYIFGPLFDEKGTYDAHTSIKELKAIEKELQQTHPDFSLRLIYTSFKFFDAPTVTKELVKAFDLKKEYPNTITGFDLVAEEDTGNTVAFYEESWNALDSLEQAYGFKLPLFLHAGESNSIQNTNLYDALTLDSKRIGHGLNLVYFPALIERVKAQNTAIEINPISNQILHYVTDIRNHPARMLLKEGVQGTLSSDDAGVFAYKGLSYDFFMTYMAWELDLKGLKKLVYNSIEYSTLEGNAKTNAFKTLDNNWAQFIAKTNTTLAGE